MTRNQVAYAQLLEQRRSNQANEALTKARDTANREIGMFNATESQRHNYMTEQQAVASLDEQSRHNVMTEQLQQQYQQELGRHNVATEEETVRSNTARELETRRSNIAREVELNRSNVANESLRSAELSEQQRYHSMSIGLGYSQLAETRRHNQAFEEETQRSNIARETETNRANVAREMETNRSNIATELERYRSNTTVEAETARANLAREQETARHNQRSEQIDMYNTIIRGFGTASHAAAEGIQAVSRLIPFIGGFSGG